MLVLCAVPFVVVALMWWAMYAYFNEPTAGTIPLSYSIISTFSIIYFGFTRRYRVFRFSQLLLILLLPFVLMVTLGGFVQGSAVIIWAFICPMAAMLFDEPKHARRWFLAFVTLVALSGFLELHIARSNNLSTELVTFFFVINIMGVATMIFLMVYYFVDQKNTFQARSETLLLNILPKEIVSILKGEQRTIADHYEGASVLFADVVDFTPMSATMSPSELVNLLNEVFSQFDLLAEKYELEKIKTIGDCYMVAAGVPRPRADHAKVLTRMALEMLDYVKRHEIHGRNLTFRIGLNSGPVVAGVIGRKKFIYDLWGDVVNLAGRMESQGREGFVQITRDTYELIRDEFICERRGMVDIKGKGETEAWFVVREKEAL